jgi:hypothetical protein
VIIARNAAPARCLVTAMVASRTALTATRRGDLQHGTNAAYVAGCVCGECRNHQRERMARARR